MTARYTVQTWAKKAVKLGLLGPASLGRDRRPGLIVLVYHRVGSGMQQEMNVPLATFRRQMQHLRAGARVVPLGEGLEALSGGGVARDAVSITFDDGYRDVYTAAWPVLRELGLPATLFLATGFLEGECGAPVSPGAAARGLPPHPLSWAQVDEMTGSGLVDVGAHSHTHREFDRLTAEEAAEECERADAVIEGRVGRRPEAFAYPRAVVGNEEVVAARYRWALGVDGGKNVAGSLVPHRVDRVPVRGSDGLFFFQRRLAGIRPLEDRFYGALRRARAGARG